MPTTYFRGQNGQIARQAAGRCYACICGLEKISKTNAFKHFGASRSSTPRPIVATKVPKVTETAAFLK